MLKYLLKRLLSLIPVVFIISVLLFGMVKAMPGDPVLQLMNPNIKDPAQYEAQYERIKEDLGLNDPIPVQYVNWLKNVASGDLGYSTKYKKPVADVVARPLQNTLYVNVISITLALVISIIVGIHSAVKRGGLFDKIWQVLSVIGMSLPTLLTSVILIYIFAIQLKWLPTQGMPLQGTTSGIAAVGEWFRYAALLITTLTIGSLASTIRYVRNAMIEVLDSDYIRTARAKGLSSKVIIYSHAFRNALIPVVTIVASSLAAIFTGAAIAEQIFSWNGIGKVLLEAVGSRDANLILALNMFFAILALSANVIADIGYALVDPRVKLD